MSDLIERQKAIDAPFKKYDMSTGVTWIPLEYVEQLPSAQPELIEKAAYIRGFEQGRTQEMIDSQGGKKFATDAISRQAAIDALRVAYWDNNIQSAKDDPCIVDAMTDWAIRQVKALPSVQPEITDEQAIGHLQASGWMQSHDKQMYEMGLKERLADDSDSYDALLPSTQPATNCSEFPNTSDLVSRKAVREMVATWSYDMAEWEDVELALSDVDKLPSAHPEVIHCKDCALWHRTGCPMNVFAEKPEPGYFCGTGRRKENE